MTRHNTALTYMGKPCREGHNGLRYANNHHCVECKKIKNGFRDQAEFKKPEKVEKLTPKVRKIVLPVASPDWFAPLTAAQLMGRRG